MIHLELNPVALSQQCTIDGRQVMDDGIKAFPEISAADSNAWQHTIFDETMQDGADLKSMTLNASGHGVFQVQWVIR